MTTPKDNEEQHPAQKREELTEEERARLSGGVDWSAGEHAGRKALRIIDAHAADRAALVARVAELEREMRQSHRVSENAIRARDAAESEVTRLREVLEAEKREANAAFCLEVQLRQAAEAQVAELEREIERLTCIPCDADKRVAESEVVRLREELAAAQERDAAANAEVERWKGLAHGEIASRQALGGLVRELRAEAAELRAKVKTAAEQRVLDACRDAQLMCWDGADGMMGESLYVVIQAELARREEARRG